VFGEISLLKYYRSLPNATKALFASFEGRGREGREGRKEEKSSPCLEVKETNKEMRWRVYKILAR